jgi:hypothetical protein
MASGFHVYIRCAHKAFGLRTAEGEEKIPDPFPDATEQELLGLREAADFPPLPTSI